MSLLYISISWVCTNVIEQTWKNDKEQRQTQNVSFSTAVRLDKVNVPPLHSLLKDSIRLDGVSEGQFKQVLDLELPLLKSKILKNLATSLH
jgi:hypothetical protein